MCADWATGRGGPMCPPGPPHGAAPTSWCGGRDLNPHGLPHWNLNPARLPISPPPRLLPFRQAALSSRHAPRCHLRLIQRVCCRSAELHFRVGMRLDATSASAAVPPSFTFESACASMPPPPYLSLHQPWNSKLTADEKQLRLTTKSHQGPRRTAENLLLRGSSWSFVVNTLLQSPRLSRQNRRDRGPPANRHAICRSVRCANCRLHPLPVFRS